VTFERDPDEEVAARARLAVVAPSLPGAGWKDATWLPSDSNDAWRRDDAVLRVCWRGDRERLRREALLARDLPSEMLHPGMIAAGEHAGMAWQLMRFVPGDRLADTWLRMEPRRLRAIVTQLAQLLKTLHEWNPTDAVRDSLAEREAPRGDPAEYNLLPLPVDRTVGLIDRIASLPYVDPTLMRAVERRLGLLADVDPFARAEDRAVVHGDAQVTNLVVDDYGIAALLDY
jgi:aminoglycoside phosphotransferase